HAFPSPDAPEKHRNEAVSLTLFGEVEAFENRSTAAFSSCYCAPRLDQNRMQTTFRFIRLSGIALLAAAVAGCAATRRPAVFSDWPPGASPEEVGKRVSENFVARQLDFQTNPRRQYVIYPEVCTWLGALRVAKLTGD